MMTSAPAPRGMYFEDFTVGQVLTTGRRTITSTDIVNFACLSGDFNDVHTNHEYCKTTPFGEPIAHGPLVFAVAAGLNYASGMNDGTLIALLGIDKWRMKRPVKHGDTIFVRTQVISKRETSQQDRGVVTFARAFVNQRNEEVQEMEVSIMYRRRPAA
ncbi:MaoC/PaaZ C-terminal domain-containing protein [Bradyrhizobium iriomotense]|uniref:MaoC/PaaZ C-terminal domain-containing protein n=1 Tax=Bradyrhizobium iriomotense TaxID=441950 RepID=UPI001B89E922|nr:MaoC/PaaZ C-terminal domain-containing protein [Bradyrhizobium iriomotense]MBR0781909.1 MaoC family dehydratase N-terminal domain-containing protein [Bradyrhizobium iriomotense]